ncbi:hypothetical protein BH24DEI1_BH24DEI1_13560 [soil metagenome]|jgi:D-aminopeptidase
MFTCAKQRTPNPNASQSRIEIDFDHQARADQRLYILGVTRAGERAVAYPATDALAFNSLLRAVMKASSIKFSRDR